MIRPTRRAQLQAAIRRLKEGAERLSEDELVGQDLHHDSPEISFQPVITLSLGGSLKSLDDVVRLIQVLTEFAHASHPKPEDVA